MSRMCGEAPGERLQGSAGPARRTTGRRGPCRTAYPSQWLGKVGTVLANPRLAHVHRITDSNIPTRGQHTSPPGGDRLKSATCSCADTSVQEESLPDLACLESSGLYFCPIVKSR